MNIDLMIKMVNEISAFFAGEDDQAQAARDVEQHLIKFWEPRMRAQLLEYFEQRHGAGLSELSIKAVSLLAAEARPPSQAHSPQR
jgi:formate dehydrogenase subunit delta